MKRTKVNQGDLIMRARRELADKFPSPETLARGRRYFEQQAKECFTLAEKFPEMRPAAEKFARWSMLPDEELANHWPLSRARALHNLAVRAEMNNVGGNDE